MAEETSRMLSEPGNGAPAGAEAYWSSERMLGVLDRLNDGVVVLGPDWRFRYINEPAGAMLGRDHADLLGAHIWSEFPDGDRELFRDTYEEAARTGAPARFVALYAPLDRWFESRVFPQDENLVILFRDVTEQHLAEEDLREHGERMSEAERIARFGVWKWDLESGRVRWSDELHRIYGLRPGEFSETVDGFMEHLHPGDRKRVWAEINRAMETLEPFVFEERIIRPDGEERILLSQGRVIAAADGSVKALVGVCHDVTDRAKIERALGASERRMREIVDRTPSLISVKDLEGRYLMTNAESGRVAGRAPHELIGHHGSEFFPAEVAAAQTANDRLAASEGEPVVDEMVMDVEGEPRTFLTVTFALPDEDGRPIETCTIATDVTERKEGESERRKRVTWTECIQSALDEDRMQAFAQPIVDAGSRKRVSSELLVRMRGAGDRSEVLLPGSFLPAAERYGLIQQVDVWMVAQAMAVQAEVATHVNLSAVTMCDPEARRQIVELLGADPAAAGRLVFEITETASPEYLEAAGAFAAEVTAHGCRLALDDFGTGFGSFTYLRSLPLSFIKIDISFVRGLVDAADDRAVVQSIIAIAERFSMKTIAEGVEDQTTLELLREMGADYLQGFHLGRPAPLSA